MPVDNIFGTVLCFRALRAILQMKMNVCSFVRFSLSTFCPTLPATLRAESPPHLGTIEVTLLAG